MVAVQVLLFYKLLISNTILVTTGLAWHVQRALAIAPNKMNFADIVHVVLAVVSKKAIEHKRSRSGVCGISKLWSGVDRYNNCIGSSWL